MNQRNKRLNRIRLSALLRAARRLGAFFLTLLLLLEVPLGTGVFASGVNPPAGEEESAPEARTVTWKSSDETPLTAGTSTPNTYMLEVSTGSVRGGSTADNVKYFVIYYTTERRTGGETVTIKRSAVIFPQKDGLRKGVNMAAAVKSRDDRRAMIARTFGYTTDHLRNYPSLSSVSADQFVFTSPDPIKTIDRIQISGRAELDENGNAKESTWACQSIHVSRVDKIYGLEMYGWFSAIPYIDYEGEVIADVVMSKGGGIFRWNNKTAGVFNITGPSGTKKDLTLVNTETKDQADENFVGEPHHTQVNNRVVFQLDFADIRDGGLECLAGSYSSGSHSTVASLDLCETAALKIRYEDIYGAIREVALPLVVNSLGFAMEKLNGTAQGSRLDIAGFAQQGDTLIVSAMLPDFKELRWVMSNNSESRVIEIFTGEKKALEETKLINYGLIDKPKRAARAKQSESESFAYTCFAAYRNATVEIIHDSAKLDYKVSPGDQDPVRYLTASSIEGIIIDANTRNKMPMMDYRENVHLKPADNRELYLLTITTDNVQNAGITSDVMIQFRYTNMKDKEITTSAMSLRDLIRDYYGEWPGNVDDFAYKYGLRRTGTVKMLFSLSDVKRFQSVSIKVSNGDEWQFQGLNVHRALSVSPRYLRWKEISAEVDGGVTLSSHLLVGRDVSVIRDPVFEIGNIYEDPSQAPDPQQEGSGWEAGSLIQDDGKYHEFGGHGTEVSSYEPFDWTDYRTFMTYEDTDQDLGFTKERCTYKVTVKVFGEKVNAEDDDCGSANLFYFQLLFEYGKSGCVLANQQLKADGFRTGALAEFYIPATQDYGDLNSVRIIPDDQDSNGDIYDKLQIEYIKVEKEGTGKITPTWYCKSDSDQGLGWVGITYQDPGAEASTRGTEGRTISQISHTFEVTKTSYSTRLLISIATGSYETRSDKDPTTGEYVQYTDPIMEGGVDMSFSYFDHSGQKQDVEPADIVHLMNQYSGLKDKKTRVVNGIGEDVDFCVSDKNYQFRPGTADKFIITVDDIQSILDMKLEVRSSVSTNWTIDNVSVYLVEGVGTRYINGNGEYDYKYADGDGVTLRASWNRPQSLTKDIGVYRKKNEADPADIYGDTGVSTITFGFEDNDFPMGDDWVAKINREPNSKDDSLNLFIYPSTESAATKPEEYALQAEVMYTDTMTQSALRVSTGNMELTTDSSGRPVFYSLGLNANYLESITGVNVKTNSVRPVHVPISFAVLQRIRSGVLIDSYYLYGAGNADLGLTLGITPSTPIPPTIQHVLLQVDQSTVKQDLSADECDLALALYFTTDDPGGMEYRTKYIYLTDKGIRQIYPGQVLDITFNIPNLREIRGINMVGLGRISVGFENAEILDLSASGTLEHKWSFRGNMVPSRLPARFSPSGLVSLLDVDLKTALSDSSFNSGTTGPIRMTVGFLDETGNLSTAVYPDVRKYVSSPNVFQAGNTAHLRFLIRDMSDIRWIELEPLADPDVPIPEGQEKINATWKLDTLSAMLDMSNFQITRVLNALVEETKPLRVSLADILLAGTVAVVQSPTDRGDRDNDQTIPTGGTLDVSLYAGDGVRIVPKLQGSKEGLDVVLTRVDPSTGGQGRADLEDTRGYTPELLAQYAQQARELGHYEEAALWSSITPDTGTWEVSEIYTPTAGRVDTEYVVFIPPHNYTSSVAYYRITMTSRENSSVSVSVTVSVPTETNPVEALLAEAQARDADETIVHEHTIVQSVALAPTCTSDGHTEYFSCSVCGKYFSDPLGENQIDLASTVISALGHTGVWERSSGKPGVHNKVCTRCGEVQTESCQFTNITSNNNGTHSRTCSVCGYVDIQQCDLPQVWTDNGDGTHSRTCSVCGYVETDDHHFEWTEDGPTEHTGVCACGCAVRESHTFGDWIVVPPTATERGYRHHVCTLCKYDWIDPDSYVDPTPDPTPEPTPEPTNSVMPPRRREYVR